MEKAIIKVYSKSELANLYERPVRTLMNWINQHEKLITELKAIGYKSTQKDFTPAEVKLIFQYLEAPYINVRKEPAK